MHGGADDLKKMFVHLMTMNKFYVAIALAGVVGLVILAVSVTKKEAFTETKATKYAKYLAEFKDMIPSDVTVTQSNAMAIISIIHDTEAKSVRNPNAKRLHNAAMQDLRERVANVFGSAESVPGAVLLKLT